MVLVNGEPITLEQLENEVGGKSKEIEQQLQTIKNSILSRLIDNQLIRQEAASQRITLEKYIEENITKVSTVSDEEVEEAYEKSKANLLGALPEDAKYRIRRTIEDNRRNQAFQKLFAELRKKANIVNFFLFSNQSSQEIQIGDSPVTGAPNAQITIVEFSDFECPYSRLQQQRLKQLLEDNPDTIKLVFKHFPIPRHKNAFTASKAAYCAQQQDQFWDFHFSLFREGQELSLPALIQLAVDQGLDKDLFTGCLNDPKTEEVINADIQIGLDVGVKGTPAFFVNGKRIESPAGLETAVSFELNQK